MEVYRRVSKMTDAAFEELYQIMLNNRKEFINKKPNVAKIFQKWKLRYDAAYFAIDFPVNYPAL